MKRRMRVLVWPLLVIFLCQSLFPAYAFADASPRPPAKPLSAQEVEQLAQEVAHDQGQHAHNQALLLNPDRPDLAQGLLPGQNPVDSLLTARDPFRSGLADRGSSVLSQVTIDMQREQERIQQQNAQLLASATQGHEHGNAEVRAQNAERNKRSSNPGAPRSGEIFRVHRSAFIVAKNRAPKVKEMRNTFKAKPLKPMFGVLYGTLTDK